MIYKITLFLVFFLNIADAKTYKIDLLLDSSSSKYLSEIKTQAKSLFSSSDKIAYNIEECDENCKKNISNYFNKNKIVLLNSRKKYERITNLYIISYNSLLSKYEKDIFIRTSALAIFEYLKEEIKTKSIYLENKEKLSTDTTVELKKLDLKDVFSLAFKNSLQIQQNENSLLINKLNINSAKSDYKPNISLFTNYTQIDEDRAKYSGGIYSEGTFNAGLKLSQLIYSNDVIQNINISKTIFKATKQETKALNDEIMYKLTLIYLNIIKAKKYNEIINIKRDFISQNLEFSKQRVSIGVQDRSDIYRWESELANADIELSQSKKSLNSLKIELANILQIENNLDFKEYGMNSELFKILQEDAIEYIKDKKVQESFTDELVFTHSRLKQLKELKEAKDKELNMNKDSRYLPTIVFAGSATKIVDRFGEASDLEKYDKEYEAIINLNLPLYEGGIKNNKIERNSIELINLKLKYNETKNLIIQNVKKNYESIKSSYEKIKFARISQNSSEKNFELIQDKYKNGKENIISLLDAQNSYIVSRLNLNISIIDYLVDLSSIYFFSGKIDILVNKDKKTKLEEKIMNITKGIQND
ncbi:MAG: hypothetical protein CL623_03470 [Arcobacter sp.]|nr:hypothetical protein [Arcobacter sp.]|tara:strand:+ start:2223 stop:3989 length:1767 start_codon:yes stop_codon:yes gene_type:complete